VGLVGGGATGYGAYAKRKEIRSGAEGAWSKAMDCSEYIRARATSSKEFVKETAVASAAVMQEPAALQNPRPAGTSAMESHDQSLPNSISSAATFFSCQSGGSTMDGGATRSGPPTAAAVRVYQGFTEHTYRLVFPFEDKFGPDTPQLLTIVPSGVVENSKVLEPQKEKGLIAFAYTQSISDELTGLPLGQPCRQ